MNLKPIKHYSQVDWVFLETELTKKELFLDKASKAFTHEQLLSYWKYLTNNTNTEIILEDKYIKAWSEWSLSENEIDTARIASNLSKFLLFSIGARNFSKLLMGISARVSEAILGKDNAETAQYINDYGFFVGELGDKKKARSLFLRAYKIRLQTLSDDHFSIAESLNNLATLESEKKALPKLQQALAIRRKSLGPAHPETLNSMRNVASTLDLLGRNNEAKSLLLEAIRICKETYGDTSAELAESLTYYSVYLWHNGLASDAQVFAKQSLDIKERVFGPKNPELVINLISISESFNLAGQHIEAQSYLQRAIDICISFYGADHDLTKNICDKLKSIEHGLDQDIQGPSLREFCEKTIH